MAMQENAVMAASPAMPSMRAGGRSLFSPVADFFLLGGGSIVVLLALALTVPVDSGRPALLAVGFALAHVINHPHFAHSYQIFYRDFGAKMRGRGYARSLQVRYVVAGIVVPIALAGMLLGAILSHDAQVLGLAGNIMFFFVGWHYVKQGYGMLMLDAALKKRFFEPFEKRVFLVNSYLAWVCQWVAANYLFHESNTWHLKSYSLEIPPPVLYTVIALASLGLLVSAAVMIRKALIKRRALPLNGVTAYLVSIYVWTFAAFYPVVGLITPAFHSLQYLAVVWRYKLNREAARPDAETTPFQGRLATLLPRLGLSRFIAFIGIGIALGYLGFWGLPKLMNALVPYDRAEFGPTMFLFVFWIFINVHHYFLDNVMWRRGNPEIQKHLFA